MYDPYLTHQFKKIEKNNVTNNLWPERILWNFDVYDIIICYEESDNAFKT